MKIIEIGNAKSEPGKLTYGFIDSMDLPTGITEKIPVMIVQGTEEGPTFFLTANIHGEELTGIAIIHDLVTEGLAHELKGTVVAIPTLNPSGLRSLQRFPEFDKQNPNRLFPEGMFAEKEEDEDEDKKYPSPQEQIAQKIYSYLEKYADLLIDLHNDELRSIPYAVLDRVFYKDEEQKNEAEQLFKRMYAMVEAFGMTIHTEFPAKQYLKEKFHRTSVGAALNNLRIPAFIAELGAHKIIDPNIVTGSIKGIQNVLKWAGMLEGPREEITDFPVLKPGERIRQLNHPRAKHSGLIRFLVEPGDHVMRSQPIARITDIFGRPLGDGYIRTEYDGYIIALKTGMTVYPNEAIVQMSIKDDAPVVVPIPIKK